MQKKKLVEEFVKPSAKRQRLDKCSRMNTKTRMQKINAEPRYLNPRATTLQNKWKLLWKMSNDRKRKLQQIFSNLIAVSLTEPLLRSLGVFALQVDFHLMEDKTGKVKHDLKF